MIFSDHRRFSVETVCDTWLHRRFFNKTVCDISYHRRFCTVCDNVLLSQTNKHRRFGNRLWWRFRTVCDVGSCSSEKRSWDPHAMASVRSPFSYFGIPASSWESAEIKSFFSSLRDQKSPPPNWFLGLASRWVFTWSGGYWVIGCWFWLEVLGASFALAFSSTSRAAMRSSIDISFLLCFKLVEKNPAVKQKVWQQCPLLQN